VWFALDFTLRNMADVKALEVVDKDREVQVGVIDIRTLYIESDDEIVDRIHKVLSVTPAARCWSARSPRPHRCRWAWARSPRCSWRLRPPRWPQVPAGPAEQPYSRALGAPAPGSGSTRLVAFPSSPGLSQMVVFRCLEPSLRVPVRNP